MSFCTVAFRFMFESWLSHASIVVGLAGDGFFGISYKAL
jgi:hypothetical protein